MSLIRGPLTRTVAKRFIVDKPLWPHSVLPFLNPQALYTTNYDELIELAWSFHPTAQRPTPIFSPSQRNFAQGYVPLYKPHGTVQHASAHVGDGGLVLTQFDYFQMLGRKREMLTAFLQYLEDSCVVFIGYSFQDMDIASMLFEMRTKDRDHHWYGPIQT